MGFAIIVDAPNFINDLVRNGYDKDDILEYLSFPILHNLIQKQLKDNGLSSHPFLCTEIIHSNINKLGPFEGDDKKRLLDKLRHQRGVTTTEINLSKSGDNEKGVDMFVFVRMLEFGMIARPYMYHNVLIGSDKDYVPAMQLMRKLGIHTILIGFEDCPTEQINESYLFINLKELIDEMIEEIRNAKD
jgi:hypothetical protein